MDSAYRARNDAARASLLALVNRLTKEDLARSVGGGWTVKATLLHLAFWDRLATAALDRWTRDGFTPSADDDGALINIAALDDWLAAAREYSLSEPMRAAEAADRAAGSVSEALHARLVAGGESWACERGVHRLEHIEQIKRVVL